MNAPPRRKSAPISLTCSAMPQICSSLSTEQGPAAMAKLPPPIFTPPTSMTVSAGWNLRLAFLYGSWMRLTSSTMSSALSRSMSTDVVSPMSPIIVCVVPSLICTCKFWPFSHATRFST